MSLTLWRSCATGKYSNVAGATACVDCAAGKYASSTGNDAETDCVACVAGAETMPRTPFGVNECVSVTMAMALSATPACTSAPARFYHAEYLCLHLLLARRFRLHLHPSLCVCLRISISLLPVSPLIIIFAHLHLATYISAHYHLSCDFSSAYYSTPVRIFLCTPCR